MEAVLGVTIDPSGAVSGVRVLKKNFDEAAQNAKENFGNMSNSVKSATGYIKGLVAAYVSFKTVTSIVRGVIDATAQQYFVNRKLEATLIATGHAAGMSAREMSKIADELQAISTYGNTAILDMQRYMAAFRNIGGNVFRDATRAALDLAAAYNMDLNQAAMTLGRALNFPTQGLQRLERQGIQFTQAQKDLVKSLQEAGDMAGAQRVILDELAAKYGGLAVAARDTLGGALQALRETWGNLFIMDMNAPFTQLQQSIERLNTALGSNQIDRFRRQIGDLVANGIDRMVTGLLWVANNIDIVVASASALIALNVSRWFYMSLIAPIPKIIAGLKGVAGALGMVNSAMGVFGILIAAGTFITMQNHMRGAREEADRLTAAFNKATDGISRMNEAKLTGRIAEQNLKIREMTDSVTRLSQEYEKLRANAANRTFELSRQHGNDIVAAGGGVGFQLGHTVEQEIRSARELHNSALKRLNTEKDILGIAEHYLRIIQAGSNVAKCDKCGRNCGGRCSEVNIGGSGISAVEQMVSRMRDEMRYLNADGNDFLYVLEGWQANLKPLSDDWKRVVDLIKEIESANLSNMTRSLDEGVQRGAFNKESLKVALGTWKTGRDELEQAGRHLTERGFMTDEYKMILTMIERIGGELDRIKASEWAVKSWEFAQGFKQTDDYIKLLQERLSTVGGKETAAGRTVFSELQNVKLNNVRNEVNLLNGQLRESALSTLQWKDGVTLLIEKYSEFPLIIRYLEELKERQGELKRGVIDLNELTVRWVGDFQEGFVNAIVEGRNFTDVLSNIGREMVKIALRIKLFGNDGMSGLFGSLFRGFLGNAHGNVFMNGTHLTKYASGGIVDSPTIFPMKHGMGLMGEAGTEAIMPLRRMPNGDLGVQAGANTGDKQAPIVNITVENRSSSPVEVKASDIRWDETIGQISVKAVINDIAQNGTIGKLLKAQR